MLDPRAVDLYMDYLPTWGRVGEYRSIEAARSPRFSAWLIDDGQQESDALLGIKARARLAPSRLRKTRAVRGRRRGAAGLRLEDLAVWAEVPERVTRRA